MREIEFRGKKEIITSANIGYCPNGWVYGDSIYQEGEDIYILPNGISAEAYHIEPYDFRANSDRYEIMLSKIKKNTLGQYTGLKDKNGKKIFEGDIVEVSIVEEDLEGYSPFIVSKFNGEVFFDKFTSKFQIVQKIYIEEDNSYEYEQYDLLYGTNGVIGNIYDNPELLEMAEIKNKNGGNDET